MENKQLSWNEFMNVEMRVGTIIEAEPFPEARNPSYKLKIDFGN
jgi:tRNA-binding protein